MERIGGSQFKFMSGILKDLENLGDAPVVSVVARVMSNLWNMKDLKV